MRHWLCCDGGGTKLLSLLVDEELCVVREHRTGGVNPNFHPMEQVRAHMQEALDATLGDFDTLLAGVFISMPGPVEVFKNLLHTTYPGVPVVVISEGKMGLLSGLCREQGFVALSGTGSDVFYEGPGGPMVIGGWGLMLGDEGSGAYIGQKGLIAAIHAVDGRGENTALLESLRARLGFKDDQGMFDALVHMVYAAPSPRSVLASFAPDVARMADQGDFVAREIIADAARQLARQMNGLVSKALRVNPDALSLPATVCGGMWKGTPLLYDIFAREIRAVYPALQLHWPYFEAVCGGVVAAGLSIGYAPQEVNDRLFHTLHQYRYPIFSKNTEEAPS